MSHSDSSAIRKPKKSRISCCLASKQTAPAFALGAVRVNALRLFSLFVLTFILLLGSGVATPLLIALVLTLTLSLAFTLSLTFTLSLALTLSGLLTLFLLLRALALVFLGLPCVDLLV